MYRIDCRQIQSYEEFVEALNKAFIESVGGKWNGNLDALNDYLSWPEPNPYQLTILGSDHCAKVLDYQAHERHEKHLWALLQEIFASNEEWVHVLFK